MTHEFWIVLNDAPSEELADRIYAAGFDDAIVTTAAAGAATVEVHHRDGELQALLRHAIAQAEAAGLSVREVVMPRESFPAA